MLELPMQQLVKSLTNPHLRIFKITLGEPYEDRNAITVKPVPTVKELVRGGEYVLLTDSVIIKRPLEALDMLKWLMIKLKRGGHQLWKIYGRPKLSSWLVDLAASYDANSEVSKTYREMYLYLDMLVPEDDRKNYYDDDWVPTFTSVFQNPVVLPGYRYGIGTDTERADVRADLVNNDRMLIKWFGSVTQPLVEDIRFFTAVSEIHDQLHENLTDEWKHIRIYPTDWFVTAYVKSTILRNQWKQEDEEIEGKS